jgi:predicted nucleic acid-binding protein
MIYLDSSSLLKLLWKEREGEAVARAIEQEPGVVLSALTELESLVQLKAAYLGGDYTLGRWRRLEARLGVIRNQPPFEFRPLTALLLRTALHQHRSSGRVHCHTLDRLHLAAMEELSVRRLMTHDVAHAKAARELGCEVLQPGQG